MPNSAVPATVERFLRTPDVASRLGLSEAAVRAAAAQGRIPAGVRILGDDARAIGWRESDINAFIASRK